MDITFQANLEYVFEPAGKKDVHNFLKPVELEKREREGTIQIKTLREIGQAMDMTLVYGFIPRDGSLEQLIARKAQDMAERIVRRTAVTMELEAQENSAGRLQQAIKELAEDLKREMPKAYGIESNAI